MNDLLEFVDEHTNRINVAELTDPCNTWKIKNGNHFEYPDPILGCSAAHFALLSRVISIQDWEGNVSPFCVLEADACATIWKKDYSLPGSFLIPSDADALYIGLSKFGRGVGNRKGPHSRASLDLTPINNDLMMVGNMLATHAIIYITREYVEHTRRVCIEAINKGKYIDLMLAKYQRGFNVYALRKPWFYQGPESNHNASVTNFSV